MNFAQAEFFLFFGIVLVVYWALRERKRQNAMLCVASFIFYGWVTPWFTLVLFGSATVDYFVGLGMKRWPSHRKKLLGLSLLVNLGLLGWFKYFDFCIYQVGLALEALGFAVQPRVLGIVLPVGISFYVFQTLSYGIDVYRKVLEPRTNFIDYLTFVTLFPQLIAGPIERAVRLLPQVEKPRVFDRELLMQGFGMMLFGLFQKIVIADTLAPFVDQVFALRDPGGPLIWAGAGLFGAQVYADVAGYTNIARGTARMLGFELSKNMDQPILATSTPDFWRRWHITVSSFFRDYLMVPMLGGTGFTGVLRLWAAVFITFIIIGVWHGAGWNYIAFGIYHAVWVLLYLGIKPLIPERWQNNKFGLFLAILFHFNVVSTPGSIIFREPSVTRALGMIMTPVWDGTVDEFIVGATLIMLAWVTSIPLLMQWLSEHYIEKVLDYDSWWWPVLRVSTWGVMVMAIITFYRDTARDFVYFQF